MCNRSRSLCGDETKQVGQMSNLSFSQRFDEMKQARLRCSDVVEHDKISGDLTENVGGHNFGFGRDNLGRDDLWAT